MTVLLKSSVKLLRNLQGINFMPKLNDVDALKDELVASLQELRGLLS